MKDLTLKQRQVLDYIKKELKEKGYPPSVREIGTALNLSSTSTVHNHLKRIEEKGYIRRDSLKTRAIEVLEFQEPEEENDTVTVPLIGEIAAGIPIFAEQHVENQFVFSRNVVGKGRLFVLKVKGNSMINAGILNGDYVVVREQNTAENGEIVAALLEDEATVKTFYKEKNAVRLQPENPEFTPIISKDVKILGKVITLVRKF